MNEQAERLKAFFSAEFLTGGKSFTAYDSGGCETCGPDCLGEAMTLEDIRGAIDKFFRDSPTEKNSLLKTPGDNV